MNPPDWLCLCALLLFLPGSSSFAAPAPILRHQEPESAAKQSEAAQESGRDSRSQRRLQAKERDLAEAEKTRLEAFDALVAEYQACEAEFVAEPRIEGPLPTPILGWLADAGFDRADWPRERQRLRTLGAFHDWWNQELYLNSPAARRYAKASRDLEEAFLAVEKLRHPERFERGFDSTPADMVLIPGGRYRIGPHQGQVAGFPKSAAEREVRLRAFYMDRREVSNADYAAFLAAQPLSLRQQHLPRSWSLDGAGEAVYPEGLEDAPVAGVAWTSASNYARWAGKRLPTEEEWEAAAAGLDKRPYPIGFLFDASKVHCLASSRKHPRPPTDFPDDCTPLGVLALSGNVSEWTADLYWMPDHGGRAKSLGELRSGAEAVVRGGSFLADPGACRSTFRRLYPAMGRSFLHIGFRCARDAP